MLIDTGDRIEGNGLYDASDPKGKYTGDIFKEQDIDIICSGNHELYKQNSSENEYLVTVPNFQGNYLASNLDIFDPESGERVPLSQRYKKFTTKNQGIRVLAFGFLFDFTGNSNNTVVQPVADTIREKWFQEAIRDREVDLFLVTGHVGLRSKEYANIFKAIRDVQWDTPIQFFGGHTHIRDYAKYDAKAYALESGRYMETIGFMSIKGLNTGGKDKSWSETSPSVRSSPTFARRYIDNNLFSFYHHSSLNSTNFPTQHGRNVSNMISSARKALKLDARFGCSPSDLWTNRAPYPSKKSIFTWLQESVLPETMSDPNRGDISRLVLINTGAIRFDIFEGPFTTDTTFTISPFTSTFRFLKDVPFSAASRLLSLLNNGGPVFAHVSSNLQSEMLAPPEQMIIHQDIIAEPTIDYSATTQQILLADKPDLTPGYTTKDDAGTDGDDTLHSAISFYRVPNCIEVRVVFPTSSDSPKRPISNANTHLEKETADPETVDVVFVDFIQPWVLLALQYLGQSYESGDTGVYMPGRDLTSVIEEWVKGNWEGDC